MSRPATRWGGAHWIGTTRVTSSRRTNEVAHRTAGRIGDQGAVGDAAAAVGGANRERKAVGCRVTYKARWVGHDGAERQLTIQQIVQHHRTAGWAIGHVHRQRVLHQLPRRHCLTIRRVGALADRYYRINRMSRPATRWGGTYWIRTTRVTSARRTDEVAHCTAGRIGDQGAVGDAATAISCANRERKAVGSRVTYKARRVGHDSAERQLTIQQIIQHDRTAGWTIGHIHRQGVLHQLPWRHGLTACRVRALTDRHHWIN